VTAPLQRPATAGIRAVYQEREYDVGLFGRYFTSLESAGTACFGLALQNPVIRDSIPDIERVYDKYVRAVEAQQREQETQLIRSMPLVSYSTSGSTWFILQDLAIEMRSHFETRPKPSKEELSGTLLLEISRLRIESPMELTLAVVQAVGQGGGVAAACIYAVHLLAKVMRDPERVGAWLPRLRAGWHKGMAQMEQARQEHEDAERERSQQAVIISNASNQLVAAAESLKELPTAEVIATSAGEPPEDIVPAFTD
jgi:hypothetical protein